MPTTPCNWHTHVSDYFEETRRTNPSHQFQGIHQSEDHKVNSLMVLEFDSFSDFGQTLGGSTYIMRGRVRGLATS
jgi:hypothetical protein